MSQWGIVTTEVEFLRKQAQRQTIKITTQICKRQWDVGSNNMLILHQTKRRDTTSDIITRTDLQTQCAEQKYVNTVFFPRTIREWNNLPTERMDTRNHDYCRTVLEICQTSCMNCEYRKKGMEIIVQHFYSRKCTMHRNVLNWKCNFLTAPSVRNRNF